jgi:hypothetical protein
MRHKRLLPLSLLPCDDALQARLPGEAETFFRFREVASRDLQTCLAPCSGRQSAVLRRVVPAAQPAIACGTARSAEFQAACKACHP